MEESQTAAKRRTRLEWIYEYCYCTGINLLRYMHHLHRRIVRLLFKTKWWGAYHLREIRRKFRAVSNHTKSEITQPAKRSFAWTMTLSRDYQKAKENKKTFVFLLKTAGRILWSSLQWVWGLRNYIFPIIAIAVLVYTIHTLRALSFGLAVEYDGQQIGFVRTEADYQHAQQEVRERIIYEDDFDPEDGVTKFTLSVIGDEDVTPQSKLADQIILASGHELVNACGVYLNDTFLGAAPSMWSIERLLDSIKEKYSTGDPTEVIEFTDEVRLVEGLFPSTSVFDITHFSNELTRNKQEQQVYIVEKGDAPTLIADKVGMPYRELKALNPNIEKSLLIGQELLISRSVPVLGVRVSRVEVYEEEVNFRIIQIQDETKEQGYTKVQRLGEKGINQITALVTYEDGYETSRSILQTDVVKEVVDEEMIVGGKEPLKQLPASAMQTSSNFIWPVDGGYLSCDFYGYYNHGGMDIAAPLGTAVRAAAAGTVEKAYAYINGSYGKYIIINHGGGVQTMYAHNSQVYVEAGQWVEQGELIAAIGRTGNASGTHCHFEIRINKVRVNPEPYIGRVYNR